MTAAGNMPWRMAANTASRSPRPDGMGTARKPIVHATVYADITNAGW